MPSGLAGRCRHCIAVAKRTGEGRGKEDDDGKSKEEAEDNKVISTTCLRSLSSRRHSLEGQRKKKSLFHTQRHLS